MTLKEEEYKSDLKVFYDKELYKDKDGKERYTGHLMIEFFSERPDIETKAKMIINGLWLHEDANGKPVGLEIGFEDKLPPEAREIFERLPEFSLQKT